MDTSDLGTHHCGLKQSAARHSGHVYRICQVNPPPGCSTKKPQGKRTHHPPVARYGVKDFHMDLGNRGIGCCLVAGVQRREESPPTIRGRRRGPGEHAEDPGDVRWRGAQERGIGRRAPAPTHRDRRGRNTRATTKRTRQRGDASIGWAFMVVSTVGGGRLESPQPQPPRCRVDAPRDPVPLCAPLQGAGRWS